MPFVGTRRILRSIQLKHGIASLEWNQGIDTWTRILAGFPPEEETIGLGWNQGTDTWSRL